MSFLLKIHLIIVNIQLCHSNQQFVLFVDQAEIRLLFSECPSYDPSHIQTKTTSVCVSVYTNVLKNPSFTWCSIDFRIWCISRKERPRRKKNHKQLIKERSSTLLGMDPLILLFPMINPPKWQRHEGDYLLMVIILVSMVSMKLIWKSTFLLLILIQMISLLAYMQANLKKGMSHLIPTKWIKIGC